MGAFVPFVDGAQVEIIYDLGGELVENRLWFLFDNPPIDGTALQGLVDGVYDWHTTNILPFLSDDLFLGTVIGRTWDTDPPTLIALNTTGAVGGTASEALSANVALVVRFRWPLQWSRLKKNKHYVPGVPESEVTLNTVSGALQDAMFEGYAALVDAARLFTPAFNWRWMVNSAFENNAARAEQFSRECIGPVARPAINLGQRRKRLPP